MVKKIALLSFTENLNYGGSLQLYALEKAIEERYSEVKCEYINYKKNQMLATIRWFARKVISFILRKNDDPSWRISEYFRELFKMLNGKIGDEGSIERFEYFWSLTNYSQHYKKRNYMR